MVVWHCINDINAFDVMTCSQSQPQRVVIISTWHRALEGNEDSRLWRASFACQAGSVIAHQWVHSVYHFYSSHGQTGYPAFGWQWWQGDIKNKKCFSMLFMCFCSINGERGWLMKLFTPPVAPRVIFAEPCRRCWVRPVDKWLPGKNETNKPGSLAVAFYKVTIM